MATLPEQIACVRRELAMRRSAYPRWIASGRLKPADAEREVARMEAVLATLESLLPQNEQPELLG